MNDDPDACLLIGGFACKCSQLLCISSASDNSQPIDHNYCIT